MRCTFQSSQMALNRYLLHVSYIGTPFLGAQRQLAGTFPRADDPSTVQGQLETALKILNPCNEPVIYLSSRTDSGVHALNTTCHVDLFRSNGLQYDPRTITICLNKHFKKTEVPIRIIKTYLVPNDFHSRHHAIWRTYLYRLCVINASALNVAPFLELMPIEEQYRCNFVCSDIFDLNEMRKASKLFEGLHDFRTFMGRGSHDLNKMTRRFVNFVKICNEKPSTYSTYSWPSIMSNKLEDYNFYSIYIQSTGFLYRQVRRMVASLIAVAQGKVSSSDIKLMLEVPSHRSWNDKIKTVPAHGLYLCEVEYLERDRATFKDNLEGGCN